MKQKHINKISDESLVEHYNKTPHLGKLSHALELPIITIWRRLSKLGLKCSTPKNELKKIPLKEILNGDHPYYQTFKLNKRLIKENILENKCDECNIVDWNDQPISFHLDHKNGISSDHRLDNLRLLCPNCHSQTTTYCGKNK
jgi:hypothetical protein